MIEGVFVFKISVEGTVADSEVARDIDHLHAVKTFVCKPVESGMYDIISSRFFFEFSDRHDS